MAKFALSVTIKLQVEASSVQDAFYNFVKLRKFIMSSLSGRLEVAGISRIAIPSPQEYIEVDAAWLENQNLRRKFQKEWDYETRQEPVLPGSKVMLVHKVALGPKALPNVPDDNK